MPCAAVVAVILSLTLWGTVTNIFAEQLPEYRDYSLTKVEWGRALTRPGHSTGGYLVRTYLPRDRSFYLAMEIGEWPARYYFGAEGCRIPEVNWPTRRVDAQQPCVGSADVIVCDEQNHAWVDRLGRYEQKVEILSEGRAVAWIYATPEVSFPISSARVEEFDPRFDAEFSARLGVFR